MKIILVFILINISIFALSPQEMVEKSDEYRSTGNSFEMVMELKSYKNNELKDWSKMRGYIKNKGSMILFLEPKKMKNRKILTVENNMWIFFPRTRKPVRIMPAQRLMGEVSNGDVASVRYSDDYKAELIGETEIKGKKCRELLLQAKENGKTYKKIKYWVEKETFIPVKAEFFATSGKHLKTAFFDKLVNFENKKILSELKIYDAVKKDTYSIIKYKEMKNSSIPDKYFNKEYLIRMR
ncbi:MAG: outer membrane lipoprotein-sorting protein [Fusobacteriota bacterium]